tara:strand:+ start:361 stop:738 length:378 start_codon:yes stop_codon:yes gene_type:complete
MTALKKKSETCEEQLRRMCKNIANGISEPQEITDEETGEKRTETASDWMEDVYDIEWITHRDHSYRAARLLVAGGGPTIWVNTLTDNVEGYWWGCDKVSLVFFDNIGLDDYLREMHANETAVLTS